MSSYLDALVFGIREVFDKLGAKLPTRTAIQFKGAVTVEDDPESKRTIVTVTGGGGGVTELDGDVTGPSTATVVKAIQGVPVDSTPTEDGQVLTFDAGDGKARWAAPESSGVESVATLAALRAIPSAGLGAELRFVEETGILWRYDAATGANELDDGELSVKPNDKDQADAGRWRPVVRSGLPGLEPRPGITIPVARFPASVFVLGARPITEGTPASPPFFAGFAIDMGDAGGVKRPSPLMGLDQDGYWMFAQVDWATLQSDPICRFTPSGIVVAPGASREVRVDRGTATDTDAELSLTVSAGDQGGGGGAGALVLKGGHAYSHDGKGGDAILRPGKSGRDAALRGIAALCDEDGVPVVSATRDEHGVAKLAFFNASHVAKPVVTGSRSDGSAWESLLDALVALGLVEDQTTP